MEVAFWDQLLVFQGLDAFLGLLPSRKDYRNNFFLVSVFVLLLAIIAFYGIGQDIGFVWFLVIIAFYSINRDLGFGLLVIIAFYGINQDIVFSAFVVIIAFYSIDRDIGFQFSYRV